jgi:hypothetical protein
VPSPGGASLHPPLPAPAGGGGGGKRKREPVGKESAYSCAVLGGARSMDERREALQAFKDGGVRLLIATDVAARGIDIQASPWLTRGGQGGRQGVGV